MPERAAFYIDGFNLYHAISDLNANHLLWCNVWALAASLIPSRSEKLTKVVFCTAFYPDDYGKRVRHERYIRAQKHHGVDVILGHYVREDVQCRSCEARWRKPTEKETDINVAVSLIDHAHRDMFDHAYLVTNDSDQAATTKLFAERFPHKRLTIVCPPGRKHSKHLLDGPVKPLTLNAEHIERAVMEPLIEAQDGLIVRPREYDPPAGWVHPRRRPR